MHCHKYLISLLLFLFGSLGAAPLDFKTEAASALVINADTGAVLYEKNATERRHPASIIKIATALYAIKEKGDELDTVVTVGADCLRRIAPAAKRKGNFSMPAHWIEYDTRTFGLTAGERIRFRDLLYCHLVSSCGDASNAIAAFVGGGSIERFVTGINGYLRELGCHSTVMRNAHGLEHPEQLTTAADMAKLTQEALKNPLFRKIVSTSHYEVPETNKRGPQVVLQSNRLLRSGSFFYAKAMGVKTGYIASAKHTFVAAAQHEGRTLIAVFMGEPKRSMCFTDSKRVFELAFKEKLQRRKVLSKGKQVLKHELARAAGPVLASVPEDIHVEFYPAEEPSQLKTKVQWTVVALPVQAGQKVGTLQVFDERDALLLETPLVAVQKVNEALLYRIPVYVWAVLAVAAALLLLGTSSRRR